MVKNIPGKQSISARIYKKSLGLQSSVRMVGFRSSWTTTRAVLPSKKVLVSLGTYLQDYEGLQRHQLAILAYLTRHYDTEHKFSFTDPLDISRAEQVMAWQHGGLGPV